MICPFSHQDQRYPDQKPVVFRIATKQLIDNQSPGHELLPTEPIAGK